MLIVNMAQTQIMNKIAIIYGKNCDLFMAIFPIS